MQTRSPRVQSRPEKFKSFVKYSLEISQTPTEPAQFADISLTGMKMISREPVQAHIGTQLAVEFTLEGTDLTVIERVEVVRVINEYVFAVRFISNDVRERNQLQLAIDKHSRFVERHTSRFYSFIKWLHSHQRGLIWCGVGMIVGITIFAAIFLSSDEHLGLKIRSWGPSYPKEWSTNYYKGYGKP